MAGPSAPRSHVVIPVQVSRAATALSLLWGRANFAALLNLGIAGILRPKEFLAPLRDDLVLPSDRGDPDGDLILRIRDPKTHRVARRQHARVTDRNAIAIAEAVLGPIPLGEPLSSYSAAAFRRCFDEVLNFLHVPTGRENGGPTPASLRGSGATNLYLASEDVQRVMWRGRWRSLGTVERYLQDSAGALLLHELPAEAKAMIRVFSDASESVVATFLMDPVLWVSRLGK